MVMRDHDDGHTKYTVAFGLCALCDSCSATATMYIEKDRTAK